MNLIAKYQINDHVDNLRRRYGKSIFQGNTEKLESLISPSDEDLAPILAMRAECDRNDKRKLRHIQTEARGIVAREKDWLLRQFMKGKFIPTLAEELGIPVYTLQYYVKKDPDMRKVYKLTRARRGRMTEETTFKIRKMLENGYTHAAIAAELHVSMAQVEYQQAKRREAGLV